MNATSLYVSTCRYILQSSPSEPDTWGDLYRYLPYLRQALSCCVCTQVMINPIGPTQSICQHHICKTCTGGRMMLKPSCSWCKCHEEFEENIQLKILIQCFKKLCEYLSTSPIAQYLRDNTDNGNTNLLLKIIHDGVNVKETDRTEFKPIALPPGPLPAPLIRTLTNGPQSGSSATATVSSPPATCSAQSPARSAALSPQHNGSASSEEKKSWSGMTDKPMCKSSLEDGYSQNEVTSTTPTMPDLRISLTVAAEHDYIKDCQTSSGDEETVLDGIPKLRLRRLSGQDRGSYENASKKQRLSLPSHKSPESRKNNCFVKNQTNRGHTSDSSVMSSPERKSKKKKQKISGCRCGLATPNPGKLTCCGQRCPCYSAFKGCFDCRCRGCRNPRKVITEEPPKLEKAVVSENEDSEVDVDN